MHLCLCRCLWSSFFLVSVHRMCVSSQCCVRVLSPLSFGCSRYVSKNALVGVLASHQEWQSSTFHALSFSGPRPLWSRLGSNMRTRITATTVCYVKITMKLSNKTWVVYHLTKKSCQSASWIFRQFQTSLTVASYQFKSNHLCYTNWHIRNRVVPLPGPLSNIHWTKLPDP